MEYRQLAQKHLQEGHRRYVVLDRAVDAWAVRVASTTRAQVVVASFCILLVVGGATALSIVGGVALTDPDVRHSLQVACFVAAIVGASFAGALNNVYGPRLVAAFAALAFVFKLASQQYLLNDNKSSLEANSVRFALFSETWAALATPLLFTAVSAILLSYPAEYRRAAALTLATAIYGIAYIAPWAVNTALSWSTDSLGPVPSYTYLITLAIPFFGWSLSILLLKPTQVTRGGNHITPPTTRTLRSELHHHKLLFSNKGLWTLSACISLFAYYGGSTLALSPVSATPTLLASTKTVSLLTTIYQTTYILGVFCLSAALLDNTQHPRKKRARMTSAVLIVAYLVLLICTYVSSIPVYAAYAVSGMFDGALHVFFGWLLASFSNCPAKQARYVGWLYAVFQVVALVKWEVVGYFDVVMKYDKFVTIGVVLIELILLGAFNYHFVEDVTEEEIEEVEFGMRVSPAVQMEQGMQKHTVVQVLELEKRSLDKDSGSETSTKEKKKVAFLESLESKEEY
ncbi:hypothetical protein HDU98_000202 [Podochytrium sp. JEL0797]|nr:hypothetical protein HDU98_000202 [Podochytrium sp. JEL0797]